jgi:hypothetical protein
MKGLRSFYCGYASNSWGATSNSADITLRYLAVMHSFPMATEMGTRWVLLLEWDLDQPIYLTGARLDFVFLFLEPFLFVRPVVFSFLTALYPLMNSAFLLDKE